MSTITVNALLNALATGHRYKSAKGLLSTEDLFRLPLTSQKGASLQEVAMNLHTQIEALGAVDFVGTGGKTSERALLEARLDVVKAVIAFTKSENQKASAANTARAERQMLHSLLREKEIEVLKDMSVEEIKARLEGLAAK